MGFLEIFMTDSTGGMDGLGPMLMSMATSNRGANMNDGFGGGGLVGGLLLGALLGRNGNGLFGNNGTDGVVGGATLRNPPEQNQANMDLMQAIGAVDKATAVSTAAMEASQATQTLGITTQLASVASSLTNSVAGVKETVNAMAMVLSNQLAGVDKAVMENRYEISQNITADGDRTRALITANYQDTLNRQLQEANAAIIELRGDNRAQRYAHDNEITVTQTVNQAQSQTQQQSQFNHLYNMLSDAVQSIRATNQAINIGAGTLTANPANTNTNTRVN